MFSGMTTKSLLVSEGNLRKFYRYVNNRLVSSTAVGIIKNSIGSIFCVNDDKAAIFNEFIASAFTRDD